MQPDTSGLAWTEESDLKEQSSRQAEKDAGRTNRGPAISKSEAGLRGITPDELDEFNGTQTIPLPALSPFGSYRKAD